ncbi:hypothetical protein LCGC14_0394540 [marine sediment metagenome]|uniref:Uncharacterized protein n=1 Tax=marine sediment metagenome TaxID=412755 RepID=A0A0F9T4N2_9ZZZZ
MGRPLDLFDVPENTKEAEPAKAVAPPQEHRATVTVEVVNRGGRRGRWSVDWGRPPTVRPEGADGASKAGFEAQAAINYMLQIARDKIALTREAERKEPTANE